jgi:hypothetical protein
MNKRKEKVKLSLCLIKQQTIKMYKCLEVQLHTLLSQTSVRHKNMVMCPMEPRTKYECAGERPQRIIRPYILNVGMGSSGMANCTLQQLYSQKRKLQEER